MRARHSFVPGPFQASVRGRPKPPLMLRLVLSRLATEPMNTIVLHPSTPVARPKRAASERICLIIPPSLFLLDDRVFMSAREFSVLRRC